ncbi:MAG: hypothetical protein PV344_09325 [Anaplasma sp.]|nr:hypothetical protein [Anaplasma sp.]
MRRHLRHKRKRLNFRGLKFSRIGPKLKVLNYSRVLIFANRM